MQALTYHGAKDGRMERVADPVSLAATDNLLRVTATAICGSDLRLYRGKVPGMEDGDILGHEFMGIVEETGPGVQHVKAGDRVVVPFTISCGECFFCTQELFAACEESNPGRAPWKAASRSARVPACSATPICTAASRAARPSSFAYRTAMSVR